MPPPALVPPGIGIRIPPPPRAATAGGAADVADP